MCRVCVVLLRVQDKNDEWFTTNQNFFISNFFTQTCFFLTKKFDSSLSLRKSLVVLLKTKQNKKKKTKKKEYYHIIYQ